MRGTILRGRWLYILLGAVVLFLYGRLFMSGPSIKWLQPDQPTVEETGKFRHLELDLDPVKLLRATQEKPTAALLLWVWTLCALGLGVGGVLVSINALRKATWKRVFRDHAPLPSQWSFQELGRLMLLLILVAGLLPFVHLSLIGAGVVGLSDSHLWTVLGMAILNGMLMLLVWGFASTKALSWSSAFGFSWRQGRGAVRQGLIGYTAVFPWVFGLLWLIAWLCQRFGIEPPVEPIHELLFLEHNPVVVGLTVALACVWGPIAEELFFRGVVFSALRQKTSRLLAMTMSGGLFALAHTNFIGFLPILLLGAFLADLYERTGSLWASIAVHMVHNTFLIGLAFILKELLAG